MNITIRNIPDEVIERIRTLSQMEKRSLNNELLIVLERGIEQEAHHSFDVKKNISKEVQMKIWDKLAKAWEDDRSTQEIVDEIYEARTLGREVVL